MTSTVGGNIILARRTFVLDRGGSELWERILGRLPAADAVQLRRTLLVTSKYPLELNRHLDEAIAEELYPGEPDRAFVEMGRKSAEVNLGGPHKAFVRNGDPHHLLGFTETIYSYYYGEGRRTYEKTGPTSAVLITHEAPLSTPADCLTVVGWYERALELSSAHAVKVIEVRCRSRGGAVCEYHLSWS
jgi:uncharacterized protein (TIGR02265 family)